MVFVGLNTSARVCVETLVVQWRFFFKISKDLDSDSWQSKRFSGLICSCADSVSDFTADLGILMSFSS